MTNETFSQTFERALTERDSKQHIAFPFTVPAGTTQLAFDFTYAPKRVDGILNLLTLTLFDPSGWRGDGHRHNAPYQITIGENRASPGFVPGPIRAGVWQVVVNTHMVMSGEPVTMRLIVRGTALREEASQAPQTIPAGPSVRRGPGWYRGDLHAHTLHSDAQWDAAGLVADARRRGLDFVTLSDHNTVSGLADLRAAQSPDLLTIGGMELTTFWGHALVLGVHQWVDWRTQPGKRGMNQIYQEVTDRGGLFIIAHPMARGDPYCTGCSWGYSDMLPGPARAVEVWNDDWNSDSNNEAGLKLACDWLNQGYRMALTSGTDNHGHQGERHLGYDVVYSEELSEQAILQAIRAGHLYISAGPRLELTADLGQQRAMMGDTLNAGEDAVIALTARWSGCPPGARLEWIADGQTREQLSTETQGTKTWMVPGGSAHWSLVALRAPDGRMLALSNPIYFDGRS